MASRGRCSAARPGRIADVGRPHMPDALTLQTSLWEILARGTAVYFATVLIMRVIPFRRAT